MGSESYAQTHLLLVYSTLERYPDSMPHQIV